MRQTSPSLALSQCQTSISILHFNDYSTIAHIEIFPGTVLIDDTMLAYKREVDKYYEVRIVKRKRVLRRD